MSDINGAESQYPAANKGSKCGLGEAQSSRAVLELTQQMSAVRTRSRPPVQRPLPIMAGALDICLALRGCDAAELSGDSSFWEAGSVSCQTLGASGHPGWALSAPAPEAVGGPLEVAKLTGNVLNGLPVGMRLIIRKERPDPGTQ